MLGISLGPLVNVLIWTCFICAAWYAVDHLLTSRRAK
jgi:hypothetical protein